MCGFVGIFNKGGLISSETMEQYLSLIRHRGPDSQRIHTIEDGMTGSIAFARLSIIDLDNGTQPIFNEDKSIVVVQNGEIYNYLELAESLKARGHVFHSQSDTEVIVHLYEEYGIKMLDHLRGMFAIVLWDKRLEKLYLIRDRIGIKPLYYSKTEDGFGFASEIKPLLQMPFVTKDLSPIGLHCFLRFGYVLAPHTIFKDIHKLEPGHYIETDQKGFSIHKYWDCDQIETNPRSKAEMSKELMEIFDESVQLHMRSDVPIGIFLSGGIDSGLIAARAAACSDKVQTYTLRFEDADFDESAMAKLVADKYGTEHHCYTVDADRMKELFPRLMWACDEPLGDSGLLPNYIINELAADDGIKVVLSGAGGDELFAGYTYYFESEVEKKLHKYPRIIKAGAKILKYIHPDLSDKLIRSISYCNDRYTHYLGHKTVWSTHQIDSLLDKQYDSESKSEQVKDYYDRFSGDDLNKCLYTDLKAYLCDDLLLLADRTSMIHSVESRVPFLDHKLVEYALGIPSGVKAPEGARKALLKEIAEDCLPTELIHLPKQGFNAPVSSWCHGDFGRIMLNVLTSSRCLERKIFDLKAILKYLQQDTALKKGFHKTYLLFTLEMYMRVHIDNAYSSADEIDWRRIYEQ